MKVFRKFRSKNELKTMAVSRNCNFKCFRCFCNLFNQQKNAFETLTSTKKLFDRPLSHKNPEHFSKISTLNNRTRRRRRRRRRRRWKFLMERKILTSSRPRFVSGLSEAPWSDFWQYFLRSNLRKMELEVPGLAKLKNPILDRAKIDFEKDQT